MIDNKEIDIKKYVILVPKKLYEQLIIESEPKIEENMIPYLYCDGIRIMYDAYIKEALLVSKDLFNTKYNTCDFIKLI
jgi:hypothetical protein